MSLGDHRAERTPAAVEDNVIEGSISKGIRVRYDCEDTRIWNNRIDGWYEFGVGIELKDATGPT